MKSYKSFLAFFVFLLLTLGNAVGQELPQDRPPANVAGKLDPLHQR